MSAGNLYLVRVTPNNQYGSGPSSVVAATPIKLPTAPLSVQAQATSATSALIMWNAPANDGGSGISGYQINYSAGGSSSSVVSNSSTVWILRK